MAALDPITFMVYFQVYPALMVIGWGVLLFFILGVMPRSARILTWAKMRRKGALVFISNDDGYVYPEIMKPDLGQGILQGKKINYTVIPRPPKDNPIDVKDANDNPVNTEEVKRGLDELVLNKMFMDVGIPVYYGYGGKSTAVNPKLLAHLEEAKDAPTPDPKLLLMDPRILKIYLAHTFSPAILDSIRYVNREIGYYSKPEVGAIQKGGIAIVLILLVAVGAYLFLTGKIQLPNFLR